MIESLRKLRRAYGSQFAIPSPAPDEGLVTPDDIARGFANRLINISLLGMLLVDALSTATIVCGRRTHTGVIISSSSSISMGMTAMAWGPHTRPGGAAW